ncbi:MAG: peptidoglycan -binding protein [Alphaproteobacteria bacterium]
MMQMRRQRTQTDIWPGFVDSLAALIMVIIFLLMIFVVAQFFLNQSLIGRDREVGVLNQELSRLVSMLSLEEKKNNSLAQDIDRLSTQLQASLETESQLETALGVSKDQLANIQALMDQQSVEMDAIKGELANLLFARDRLAAQIEALEAQRESLTNDIASRDQQIDAETAQNIQNQAEIVRLNQQMAALRDQLGRLEQLLSESEQRDAEAQAQIVDLGSRLNVALASKVNELAQYRSEFFGKLREILGTRQDIQIVGDRFVFQSEVLFDQGSAALGVAGQLQLARLSNTLKEIIPNIPEDLNWVLQVEGHTDRIPISTAQFRSNWELSTARALSVVRFLISQGIAASNLSAAGFGEFQPLVNEDTAEALQQNRRIELKFTNR